MTQRAWRSGILLLVCTSQVLAWRWPLASLVATSDRAPALAFSPRAVDWQHNAIERARQLQNSSDVLQLLVETARQEQIAKGLEKPAIVITIANDEGVSDLLPIFASTLHDVAPVLAATTIVIAVGQSAYEECRKRNVLCFYDEEAAMRNKELELLNNNMPRNKTPKFLQIGWDKLQRLQEALQMNATILFADTDIAWLRDPLPHLLRSETDLQLTHDGWGPNIGVMFVKPTRCTHLFMSEWLARRVTPDARDQYEFPAAVESATQKCPSFKVEHLEKSSFPNGCCCGKQFPSARDAADKWVLWHAACGGDLAEKKRHLENVVAASQAMRRASE